MRTTTWKRAGAGALSLALALGGAACGDDDEPATSDDAGAATDGGTAGDGSADTTEPAAFCEPFFEFQGALFETPEDPAGGQSYLDETLLPLVEELEAGATPAVEDAIGTIGEELGKGIESAFASYEDGPLGEAVSTVQQAAADDCGYERIEVQAVDYGYGGMPEDLEAGSYAFVLENTSDVELHEIGFARLLPESTLSFDDVLELPEEETEEHAEVLDAFAFAPPGATAVAFVDLTEPGTYGYACFIPVGSGEDGPPHFTEGMKGTLTVS